MKKLFKLMPVLFIAVAIISVLAISAFASEPEITVTWVFGDKETTETVSSFPELSVGDYKEYKNGDYRASYRVKNISVGDYSMRITLDPTNLIYYSKTVGGTTTYVGPNELGGETLADYIKTDMANAASGAEFKFYADIVAKTGATVTKRVLKIDLNGFKYVIQSNSDAFSVSDNGVIYLYSSRPDGAFYHSGPGAEGTDVITPKNPATQNAFYIGNGGQVNLGSFFGADGDNLSTFTNVLANCVGQFNEGVYALNIDGGSYYRYESSNGLNALFYLRDTPDHTKTLNVSIKNATLNAVHRIFYFYFNTKSGGNKTINVEVENCVISATVEAVQKHDTFIANAKVNFKDCYFLTSPGNSEIVSFGEGCRLINTTGDKVYAGYISARSDYRKTLTVKSNKFTFTDYVCTYVNPDDPKKNVYSATMQLSSLDIVNTTGDYYFTHIMAKKENTSEITWVVGEKSETEIWLNGSTPSPALALPTGGENYYYTFGQKVVEKDATYVARPVANFNLKVNLTLSSDFIYNVYIPESAIGGVKEIRAYNESLGTFVLERDTLATIDGTPYYRYWFNIAPYLAADEYVFMLDIYMDNGETFTQNCNMSIPAYSAQIIYNDKYSEKSHELMRKTLVYIKSAVEYFDSASDNLYYSVIEKISGIESPKYREGTPKASVSGTSLEGTYLGSSVIFGSKLKYRLYFDINTDFSSKEVYVTHFVNGSLLKVRLTDTNTFAGKIKASSETNDSRYYEFELAASDMRSDIVISSPSDAYSVTEYTYNLDNYIYTVNAGTDEAAKTLVYSLWEYSLAASRYVNEIPTVDVTINGTPIADYKIVANTKEELEAARVFRHSIEHEHGITLDIVSSCDGYAIVFKSISPESNIDFEARIVGNTLLIECAYRSFFSSATNSYVNDVFCNTNVDINVDAERVSFYNYGKILYSDFDVPTFDGTTEMFKDKTPEQIAAIGAPNAFHAIKLAHTIANKKGYDVYAEAGKVYYISDTTPLVATDTSYSILINTNTYWQGAEFIIDDTNVSPSINSSISGAAIFYVDETDGRLSLTGLVAELNAREGDIKIHADEKKLNVNLGYKAMLYVNAPDSYRHYIRYTVTQGTPANQSQQQHDFIIVDEEGNIDPTTPFHYDYYAVSSIYAYRIHDREIVVDGEGAVFTTLSSQVKGYSYTNARNLRLLASNSTLKNVTHVIYNEGARNTNGHGYTGFFYTGLAYNVEFNNCVAQARVYHGTGIYDISAENAVNVSYINCTQSNLFDSNWRDYWYIMGSNFCKNILFDGCVLSRFDAHCGVYNATIRNSTLTHLRLTGSGNFLMENTTFLKRNSWGTGFLELREDYGSTWHGTIEIKDCVIDSETAPESNDKTGVRADTLYCINSIWVNHYFGYQTYLPNVIIDNLTLSDRINGTVKNIQVFRITNGAFSDNTCKVTENPNGTWDEIDPETKQRIPDFEEDLVTEDFSLETLINSKGETKVNANPYIAPTSVIIKNNFAKKNYTLSGDTVHDILKDTHFAILPLPFDKDPDSPFVDFS